MISHETLVNLIGGTAGLSISAELDTHLYEKVIRVSNEELGTVNLQSQVSRRKERLNCRKLRKLMMACSKSMTVRQRLSFIRVPLLAETPKGTRGIPDLSHPHSCMGVTL